MRKFNLVTAQGTSGFTREAVYGCLDTIATLMVDNVLEERMTDADKRTHDFYMAIQSAAMEMTLRGIAVDPVAKQKLERDLRHEKQKLLGKLQTHPTIKPIWDGVEKNTGACPSPSRKDGKHKWQPGVEDTAERKCLDCGASRLKYKPFSPSSDPQMKHLVYDLWRLKPITNKEGKVTADKEARQRLIDRLKVKEQQYAEPLTILNEYADVEKQLEFLGFRSDDGRFYSKFNVGVTETHRWSSSHDDFGRGANAQNITEKHRHIFVPDTGYELCYADLKQAESKVISFVAGDEAYIEAHEGGDTHTFVCRLVWPEGIAGTPWTGDLGQDKIIATSANPKWDDRPGHDFRFQSKAVQHGSNLGLTPYGMAIQKRIPVDAASEGQARYFKAFPGIRNYQADIREKVQNQEAIITPLRIRFKIMDRPWDEHTYKKGLSAIPQSMVGHIISIGCWRIQRQVRDIQLLAQVHDAILFQFPKGRYDLVYQALKLMEVPVPIKGLDGKVRTMTIGTEAAVGMNWGHKSSHNPDGISEITFKSPTEYKIK